MKKVLLKIVLLASCIVNAQSIKISQGPESKSTDGSTFSYYIGNDETGIYIKRTSTKGKGITQIIQKLDAKTLKQVYATGFQLEERTGRYMNPEEIHSTFLMANKVLIFSTRYDVKESIKYFLLREFDAQSGKAIGDRKIISSMPSDPFGTNGRNFYISFSPDKSKMAVVNEFRWPKKASEVTVTIYNSSTYAKLNTKTLIDGYNNSTIASSNYRIDDAGTFYYLFNYMIDFEEEIGGIALASIQADETKSVVTPLPFDKLEIKNGTFEFVNNNLVFSGIFRDIVTKKERKAGKIKDIGVYSFFIDGKTSEVKKKGFDYFAPEVKEKLTYKDGMIQESPADKFYSFENIFTFNDNVYLIESHSYAISSSNSYTSYERELIVSKFNKDGKLEWMKIIPKFTANNLNNFNYVIRNNKVYLLYAEHPKNLEKGSVTDYDGKRYADVKFYNGSVLVCTSFDEKGNLSRKEVFKNEGWCYDPISTNILLDKDNGLLIRMINKGEERYDKVSID